MKSIKLVTMAAIFISAVLFSEKISAQTSFGKSSLINEGWLFIQHDEKEASNPDFDDSKWNSVNLPHDWSAQGTLSPNNASCTGFLPAGIGWYRKHLDAKKISGQKAYIYFEGVYNRSIVYLNGHLL